MVGGPRGIRGVHSVCRAVQPAAPVPVPRRGSRATAVGGVQVCRSWRGYPLYGAVTQAKVRLRSYW